MFREGRADAREARYTRRVGRRSGHREPGRSGCTGAAGGLIVTVTLAVAPSVGRSGIPSRREGLVHTRIVVVLSAVLAGACGPAPRSNGGPADMEELRGTLRAAAEAYQDAASAKDAAAVVSMYDASALMVPPDAELVGGIDGVRAYRFGFIETPGVTLEFELQRVEVAASGDIGWTLSIGQITIARDDGTMGHDVVRDFHTWRRQADGSWKVVVDIWNSGVVPGS
jgi:ketosteroid isomerase-like protein